MPSFSTLASFFSATPAPMASSSVSIYTAAANNTFDPALNNNLVFLTGRTEALKNKLSELQNLDKNIIAGLAVGTTAFALSSLLPFGVSASIAGFGYSAYYIGKREAVAKEYRAALSDAVKCLTWALSQVTNDSHQCQQVNELFDVLSPLMSEDQIRDVIDDQVEEEFVEKAKNQTVDLFDRPLNKQEKALVYGIYGYKQGGVLDVGKGLWYLACQAASWIAASVKSLWTHQETPISNAPRDLSHDDTEMNNILSSAI